jgi:hypothetical protein
MAPQRFSKVIMFVLAFVLLFAGLPAPALAAPADELSVKVHPFQFYFDPSLVTDIDFAQAVLPKYVADMNRVLAKNTSRQLSFDPANGIIITNIQPHSNSASQPLPTNNFEIWAYAVKSAYGVSYGGYMGVDQSGAGVLAGLKWSKLYDPDRLQPDEIADYWTQINNMLHELAHVFGAGIGEYYSLANIRDTTGISPLLNIELNDIEDAFWKDKSDFRTDPLLQNAARTSEPFSSREALLDFVQYSNLTAALVSGDYRNAAPTVDLSNLSIHVVDSNGIPIEAANVKVWSIVANAPYQSQLIVDTFTNEQGQITFSWGGSTNPHNIYDLLRLIKIYKDGYVAAAKYISIFDTDIEKLVNNNDQFDIMVTLNKPVTSTFEDISISDGSWRSIEVIYSAGITGGCGTSPRIYCPAKEVTRAEMAVFLLRGMHGATYTPPAVGNSTGFADVPANYWAAAWIKQLAAEGITSGCGGGNFCPQSPVTRDQMVVFLLRAKYGVGYIPPAVENNTGFTDVATNYWAAAWIKQLAAEGITSGCGGGNFCPGAAVTRDYMAVFLVRTFNLDSH